MGLWLLLARVYEVPIGGASWLALVQVHGALQLFGFVGLFLTGVGLHLLPRLRGAPAVSRGRSMAVYGLIAASLALRAVAQPIPGLPGREAFLAVAALTLVAGTVLFALTATGILRSGTNPHRADELVIGAGMTLLPVAALLDGISFTSGWPLVVPAAVDDRATWLMLLGCVVTTIVGVWARLAPGFVAAPPCDGPRLLGGAGLWLAGVAAFVLGLGAGAALMFVGLVVLVVTLGVWGATIAQQPLAGHARLTRLALRSAFAWALAGTAILALAERGLLSGSPFLVSSAARHAFALGFVWLAIFGVAARALPSFLGRRLWSLPLHGAVILVANLGVGLRVVPQALSLEGSAAAACVALSGVLAYCALAGFGVNIFRTLRGGAPLERIEPGASAPLIMR